MSVVFISIDQDVYIYYMCLYLFMLKAFFVRHSFHITI